LRGAKRRGNPERKEYENVDSLQTYQMAWSSGLLRYARNDGRETTPRYDDFAFIGYPIITMKSIVLLVIASQLVGVAIQEEKNTKMLAFYGLIKWLGRPDCFATLAMTI